MTKKDNLTKGPIAKSLIMFALPILFSNLFQQLYNAVDTAVVGRFAGSASLAAVGGTGTVINLLIGFFLGLSTGTGVLYAMHYGAKNHPALKKLIDSALIISILSGLFISLVGIFCSRPMLLWMNTPEEVMPLAMTYLRIYFSGTIVNLIYNVGASIIRAEGDSTRPLIYLVVGGVSNLVLDLALVAGFHTGVAGAAIATVAAQAISAVLVVLRLMKLNPEYRLRPLKMKLDGPIAMDIIRISVPCGLQSSMFHISNLLVQARINAFGTAVMAGMAAYSKIDGFGYMPLQALGLTVSTFVGQNIGAKQFERLRKGIRFCLVLGAGIAIFFSGLIIIFCRPLLGLFTEDAAAQEVGMVMMRFLAPFIVVLSFGDVFGAAVRGAGQAAKITAISLFCICVFRILWIMLVLPFFNTMEMVFVVYPISWTLNVICTSIFYFRWSDVRKAALGQPVERLNVK